MASQKVIDNVKDVGSILINIGAACTIKPYIDRATEDRNGVVKTCAYLSGTVASVAMSEVLSNVFDKAVDQAANIFDELKESRRKRKEAKKEESSNGGQQN